LGLMRWIAQLLGHGVVRVLPYALYRHADTADRLEERMAEAWYHDSLRADWELYVAAMGKVELAQAIDLITNRTVPIYPMAQDCARQSNRPLDERTFLLRYLAYTRAFDPNADAKIRDWERTRLIAAVIVKLIERLDIIPSLKRVIVETGAMNLVALMRPVLAKFPQAAMVECASADFLQWAAAESDFLLSEYWEALSARAALHADDPARRLAVGDLIASLRIPYSEAAPMLEGPDGSTHRSRL